MLRRALKVGVLSAIAVGAVAWYLRTPHPLQDDVKSALRLALRRARIGDNAGAEAHYLRALDLARQSHGEKSWEFASVASTAGLHFAETGQQDLALPLLSEGWGLLIAQGRHDQAAAVALPLADILVDHNKHSLAENFLNHSLKHHGADGALLERLGATQLSAGRVEEAVATLKEALPVVEKQFGMSACETGMVLLNSAIANLELGNMHDAGALLLRAASINERPPCAEQARAPTLLALGMHKLAAAGDVPGATALVQEASTVAAAQKDVSTLKEANAYLTHIEKKVRKTS